MATRCYFDSATAPSISPAFLSGWTGNNPNARLRLNRTTKAGSAMATTGTRIALTVNPGFTGIRQFVLEGLAAQSITGTIKGQMRCQESAAALNATLAIAIGKCASDGSGVTVILAQSASDNVATAPPEMNAVSLVNRRFLDVNEATPITIPTTAVSLNDALIVEVGYWHSGANGSRSVILRLGDAAASDLAEDDTSAVDNNPWIEFSMDIVLASDPPVGGDANPYVYYQQMRGM